MELRHLRYFIAVAEERNISRAARRLHVSQPPLSRQIRDLESEIGITLLHRGGGAIELTQAGQVFLVEARAALQRVDDAVGLARAAANRKRNHIRVGHTSTLAIELIPRALKMFQLNYPEAKIELRTLSTLQMIRALNSGQLDLAITVHGKTSDFPRLNVRQIGACDFRVAFHKAHRFAKMRKVPLKQLGSETIISLSPAIYPWYSSFVQSIIGFENSVIPIMEEHDNAQSVIAAVEAGRGVAIVYAVMSKTISSRVSLRPIAPEPPAQPILTLSRDEEINPLIRHFIAASRTAAMTDQKKVALNQRMLRDQ